MRRKQPDHFFDCHKQYVHVYCAVGSISWVYWSFKDDCWRMPVSTAIICPHFRTSFSQSQLCCSPVPLRGACARIVQLDIRRTSLLVWRDLMSLVAVNLTALHTTCDTFRQSDSKNRRLAWQQSLCSVHLSAVSCQLFLSQFNTTQTYFTIVALFPSILEGSDRLTGPKKY